MSCIEILKNPPRVHECINSTCHVSQANILRSISLPTCDTSSHTFHTNEHLPESRWLFFETIYFSTLKPTTPSHSHGNIHFLSRAATTNNKHRELVDLLPLSRLNLFCRASFHGGTLATTQHCSEDIDRNTWLTMKIKKLVYTVWADSYDSIKDMKRETK